MRLRRVWPACALLASLTIACEAPPDKEIQQAQTAIDTARTAGADRFATEEFTAAQDALKRANEAVTQRDYRLALNHALDARERAQTAAKDAAGRKAAARKDADRALADVTGALKDARARLVAAETARAPAPALKTASAGITNAESAVQKARTAAEQGDYRAAIDGATSTAASLRQISHDLEAAAAPPPHRRRSASGKN